MFFFIRTSPGLQFHLIQLIQLIKRQGAYRCRADYFLMFRCVELERLRRFARDWVTFLSGYWFSLNWHERVGPRRRGAGSPAEHLGWGAIPLGCARPARESRARCACHKLNQYPFSEMLSVHEVLQQHANGARKSGGDATNEQRR